MSSRLPPLAAVQRGHVNPSMAPENSPSPLSTWSSRSMSMARSSSPAHSSSPPRTPYSSRESDKYAYIHNSSPTTGRGFESPTLYRRSEDPIPWNFKQPRLSLPFKSVRGLDMAETNYSQDDVYDLPPSSEMEVEDVVEDAGFSLPEIDSETTSDSTPGHESIYFSDSEEDLGLEENDEDGMFIFGYSTLRFTCFRVSSERGQWKDDPMALEPSATANFAVRLRQPTLSLQASEKPSLSSSRPSSEPLPSTTEQLPLSVESTHDDSDGKDEQDRSSNPLSERPVTPERQTLPEYSSPLPPSSPLLSPMSGCVSSMSRSVSPLSLPPSSPVRMPCGELQIVEEEDNTVNNDDTLDVNSSSSSILHSLLPDDDDIRDMPADVKVENPVAALVLSPHETSVPSRRTSPDPMAEAEPRIVVADTPVVPIPPTSQLEATSHVPSTASHSSKLKPAVLPVASGSNNRSGSPDENAATVQFQVAERQKSRPRDDGKPLRDQDDNSELPSLSLPEPKKSKKQGKGRASEAPPKRKANSGDDFVSDAPAPSKKRRQGSVAAEKAASSSSMEVDARHEEEEEEEEDALPQPKALSTKGRRKRATSSKTAGGPSKRKRVSQLFTLESPQKTNDTELIPEEVDAEMQGMIIECMATSRASSMPVSLVVRTVLQAHPGLKEQRTEKEWKKVVGRVLENGTAGRGSGVFGKVDSSGKDDSDRRLEAQWFYIPEMDEDQDRAALIRSMMPRPGKRSVTKQYKQYYWRPLDKISRWDPDDAL